MNEEKELLKRKINVDVDVNLAGLENGTEELDFFCALSYAYEILYEYRIRGKRECPIYNVGYAKPLHDEMYLAHCIADAFDIDEFMADDFDVDDYHYTLHYYLCYHDDAYKLITVYVDVDEF